MTQDNLLFFGDNLHILRDHIKDESVDLVYLDPPFNSNATYNVLFKEHSGAESAAQIRAFGDTWTWDEAAATALHEMVLAGGKVSEAMQAFALLLGHNNMLAYLAMMAPRLVELRRVLKPTGSLYLHCDPTASHYLKVLMDAVFGAEAFRSEIIWKRSSAHSDTKQGRRQHGRIHDILLFYTKSDAWTWNPQYTPYDTDYVAQFYRHVEEGTGRRYRLDNLTAAKPGGDTSYEWHGVKPYEGRYWAYSRKNMERFEQEGRLLYARTGMPSYKRYLDEMPGVALQDVWTDIPPLSSRSSERLEYATQKPEALLERIIKASSNEGDTVLDPFCGCGTAIVAAQKLKRRWIGIDITAVAITLIKKRLFDAFGSAATYEVMGEPTTVQDAAALARQDAFQFEWWACGLVGGRRVEGKKGSDEGIDGRLYFYDDVTAAKPKLALISVKSGHTGVAHVRDLRGVLEREKAELGLLITLHEPTAPMRAEAAAAGGYLSPLYRKSYARLQVITVGDLLAGKRPDMPPLQQVGATFKKAPKAKQEDAPSLSLLDT